MRVTKGKEYRYNPSMWDIMDNKTDLVKGDIVKVVHPSGCPKPNTMGHCHVEKDGKFQGLVHCNSLESIK